MLLVSRRPHVAFGGLGLSGGEVLLRRPGGASRGPLVADEAAGAPVEDAAKIAGDADGPGQRSGTQADLLLDLVHQTECVPARPVPLVDHGDHGDPPVAAYLEELERLRLEALGGVDEHDGGIHRGEDAVGVLREVGVTGRVHEIDHVVAVGELECSGGDGDTAGALHVHPVRDGATAPGLSVDGARFGDDFCVQRECLGQGGLARVGVTDHREGATALRLANDVERVSGGGVSGAGGHRCRLAAFFFWWVISRPRPRRSACGGDP